MTGLTAHAGLEKFYLDRPVQKTRSRSDRPDRDRSSRSGLTAPDQRAKSAQWISEQFCSLARRTDLTGPGQAGLEKSVRPDRGRSARSGKPASNIAR
ncbi:hypothetical protein TIFTF001_047481 [Ficus carica]|uniref:Uncharacterized protein n=1 Tax=Ficus carica TaxID=3494 RepID=A0AA88CMV9_FICCA|nr:hypothetical protein TIFTF001_047481 [Ficus carica]